VTAIDFPNSPSVNDTHTVGDRTWKWNGSVWGVVRATDLLVGPTGVTGSTGPTGADASALPVILMLGGM